MPVKLVMTWDISPDHEQEYFEFVIGEFIPSVQRLGLEPVDAWATVFGSGPQILVGMLAADAPLVRRFMRSKEWEQLRERLFALVENFAYKIIPARGGFQF